MSSVNLTDIQQKLYEKLVPSGWGNKLKTFILSDDFLSILQTLLSESQSGKRFTPVLKQIFRAFEECPYEELKVVMIGQDPYPQPLVADGVAFSCSNTGKPEASLRNMFKELETTVYPDGYTWDPNLDRWSKQGVLMLNTALTTQTGQIGAHMELWKPFITFLMDMLAINNSGLIYVYMGAKAKDWAKMIPANNYKFFTSHPAAAAYRGGVWDSGGVFTQVNKILKENQNFEIKW